MKTPLRSVASGVVLRDTIPTKVEIIEGNPVAILSVPLSGQFGRLIRCGSSIQLTFSLST